MRRVATALAAALLGAEPLAAQLSVHAGGVRARYAGGVAATAVSIVPRFDWTSGPAYGSLEGGYSRFTSGGYAFQANAAAAASQPVFGPVSLGVLANAGGNWLQGGTWTGQGAIGLGLGARAGPAVLSIGGSAGIVRSIADTLRMSYAIQGGASVHPLGFESALKVQRAAAGVHWTDVEVHAGRRIGRFSFDVGAGVRSFDGAGSDDTWHVQTAAALAAGVTIDAAIGSYPRSPDGFTDGRYATLGLRASFAPRSAAPVVIERVGDGRVRVRFDVPGASRVEIAGEWNAWSPVALTKGTGHVWTADLSLGSGAHKFVLVVDGKQTVPRGVPSLPDGFGGTVGLLVL